VFTKACLGYNDDIAVVMLSEKHAYLVNEVTSQYPIQFCELSQAKNLVERNVNVLKVGISTLVTRGKIQVVMPNGNFIVRPTECGAFAAPGDSGAVIVSDEEDDTRGLVLGIIAMTDKGGRAQCVAISAMYAIDLIKDC
jgi:hypothetical protein